MSERKAFEKWFESQYGKKPMPVVKQGDEPHTSTYMTMFTDGAWKGYQAAVEHCKQGEPVGHYSLNGTISGMTSELPINTPLFAHAMPKSEEADASDIERLQINSDLLDDVLNWLRERDLYHDADYFGEGPDLAAILSAHEDELLRPWPASPL